MSVGSLVKIKDINANHDQDRGKMAVIISTRIGVDGLVCKLHFFDHDYKYNEYHVGRLEVVNAIH